MILIYLLAGLVVGALIGWLFASRQSGAALEAVRKEAETVKLERSALLERVAQHQQLVSQSAASLQEERVRSMDLHGQLEKAKSTNENLLERLNTQRQELESLQVRFTKEFENLANKILDEKSQKFTEQNRNNLDVILNPLKEKIKDFEQKVEQAYKQESVERNTLKGEIRILMDLNRKISEEAENLARALKGDTKKQGNWGEFILEKILEHSGLIKGQEYDVQVSSTDEHGKKLQPDVVVYLPDDKHVIVDSKVSLVAYESMVNAGTEEERDRYMKDHLMSIRSHIKGLSDKNYQAVPGFTSPDFVLLFMPIESSFGLAVQADRELFTYAWDRKVVIVSPSTLLATLRTIAALWKQDRQTRNALEIARLGGGLYDKFKGFVDDLIDVGKKMDAAKGSYADAMSKLTNGSGNILRKVEELRKLGAKTTKELPATLVERSAETPES